MKQLILSVKKQKQNEAFKQTRKFAMIKSLIRLPVEWQILFALLLLMVTRLTGIVVFIVKQF